MVFLERTVLLDDREEETLNYRHKTMHWDRQLPWARSHLPANPGRPTGLVNEVFFKKISLYYRRML
jgi:hypothetical protein